MKKLKRKPLNHTGRSIQRKISSLKNQERTVSKFVSNALNKRDFYSMKINSLKHLKNKIGYGIQNEINNTNFK